MPTQTIIDSSPLGILAGEGELPTQLIDCCLDNNIPVAVVQFTECSYETYPDIPLMQFPIEKVGGIFSFFKSHNVKNIVMIGAIKRPSLLSLRPDVEGFKTLLSIGVTLVSKGDDALLTSLRQKIEKHGFAIRGIDYYLTDLTCVDGPLGENKCTNPLIETAIDESLRHGAEDKGQSILFHSDGTYSYETREGTTALIMQYARSGSTLVKMVKPGQDRDVDRPTVGLDTLKALKSKGADGMVIESNGVLIVDKNNVIDYANVHGLFVEGVTPNA